MGNFAHLISKLDDEYIYIYITFYTLFIILYNCLFPSKSLRKNFSILTVIIIH